MAKKLVSEQDVEALVTDGNFYLDDSVILTAGAKDILRTKGIAVVHGSKPETCAPKTCNKGMIETTVAAILKKKHGITDEAQIKAFSSLMTNLVKKNA